MSFKVVAKKQSIYIFFVSIVIVSISIFSIHAIYNVSQLELQPEELTHTQISNGVNHSSQLDSGSENLNKTNLTPEIAQDTLNSAAVDCKISGCNNELCIDANEVNPNQLSACQKSEASKCYAGATCTIQAGGKCGWSVNATINRCLADSNFATQDLRVLELRFISNPNDVPFQPADLSLELQEYIKEASTYHTYKDAQAKTAIQVKIIDTITIPHGRENIEDYWYGSYYKMIQDMDLCTYVEENKIDQIWMWVDPRDMSSGPGLEYAISSKYFLNNGDGSVATPPFCEGRFSFTIMGFDYTRTTDLALHSFGHFMEGVISNMQGNDLFWDKFVGNFNGGTQSRVACGNVHFPPNGTSDYNYSNPSIKATYCQNWNPQGTGTQQNLSCTTWGCNQEGYLKWWMQNMPGFNNTLTYQSKKIPPWWDFLVDMDKKIAKYNPDAAVYFNNSQINVNDVDLNSDCSCNGADEGGDPVTINQCWQSIVGADANCYQCVKNTFYIVPDLLCNL